MKRILSNIFFAILYQQIAFRLMWFKWLNRKMNKILVYTDSRGHEITHLYNKQNPFSAYTKYFIKHCRTDALTVPEKHTTFYDFLFHLENTKNDYEHIVGHVGVVCFAPRPISQMEEILALKKLKIEALFGSEIYEKLQFFEGYDVLYKNERTSALVPEFMLPLIAEKLNKIENLIWINCNGVAAGWLGNYKERPDNLDIVHNKSITLVHLLNTDKIVDLTKWTDAEIKQYTCDNVHLTDSGMAYIEERLRTFID